MAATTRIHEVVDAILSLAAETGVQVLDGPSVDEPMLECLVVGLAEDQPGYTVTVTREPGVGRPRMREEFTVRCLLSLVSGDTATGPLRARAASLLGDLDDRVRSAHRRPGVWEHAEVSGEMRWVPLQSSDGHMVGVWFQVNGWGLL